MDNIEAAVIAWLQTISGDYTVTGNIPAQRPDKFITVDRTGGGREAMVLDRAEILIEVYNKDDRLDASNMANLIGDHIVELLNTSDNITRAVVNSTVNLTDLIGQYERYQVYCDVYHRR
jgi:hypothetical protein